jgi:hypothetical protein
VIRAGTFPTELISGHKSGGAESLHSQVKPPAKALDADVYLNLVGGEEWCHGESAAALWRLSMLRTPNILR